MAVSSRPVRRFAGLALLTLLVAVAPRPVLAGAAEDKLGKAYTDASPVDKLVLLSVARAEQVLDTRQSSDAVEEVVRSQITPAATPEARLRVLGALRKDAAAAITAMATERRTAGKKPVSFIEPASETQLALALEHIATVAGDQPTLAELGCLALVREATAWSTHHDLVLAFVQEALNRDEAYRAGDLEARLKLIRDLAVDRQMMSDHERTRLEKALLVEHLGKRLQAGATAEDVLGEVKGLGNRQLIIFFTKSWAEGMVRRLGEHRALRR